MRDSLRVLVPSVVFLGLVAVAPAMGGWSYGSESVLRPDRKGEHPPTHLMVLEATRATPAPGCVCVQWQNTRGEGKRGSITVVASILRPRRGGALVKRDEITLGPFRPENFGSFTDVSVCAPTVTIRAGDRLETRWAFSGMRPMRTGFSSAIYLRQSLGTTTGACR